MTPEQAIASVESRAFALRMTMGDVCKIADIAHSTWSRAKSRGYMRPRTLEKVEQALGYLEKQKQDAA